MSDRLRILLLLGAVLVVPGLAWWGLPWVPLGGPPPQLYSGGSSFPPSPLPFRRQELGDPAVGLPLIANLQVLDFTGDGQNDILACDVSRSRISLVTRNPQGDFLEQTLIEQVAVPAHVTPVDIDGDGDLDLIVSILGNILPDDGVIGRVELYENTPQGFVKHVILDDVRRVADVQVGDFNGNGRLDLAVAVFGYARGQVLWLENLGDFQFREHELLNAPGTIHVPVADFNGDGYPDIAAIVSQDEEELWIFENLQGNGFRPRRIWRTPNLDLGSAGLIAADLDGDGKIDLILPTGDNLEDAEAYPQPYHGCWWFENKGNWEFEPHRISDFGGTYAAEVADFDGDGDLDIVLVSMTNDWYDPSHASIIWLENDGEQNFTPWMIDTDPIHLVCVAVGDVSGNGKPDIVAGSLNLRKPFERIGRITLWENGKR